MMEVLGNAGDEQGLELSQGLRSEDRILGPSPAQLCTADITSHLVWQWKAFFRAAGAQMLQLCQPVSTHCSFCHGNSPSPLPTSATDLLRNGILETFIKKALFHQVCWSS